MIQICRREELDVHQPKRDAKGRPANAVLCLRGDGSGDCSGVYSAVVPGGGHRWPPHGEQPAGVRPQEGVAQKDRPHVR